MTRRMVEGTARKSGIRLRASMVLPRVTHTPPYDEPDLDAILVKVVEGNRSARDELFAACRPRIWRMVQARYRRKNRAHDDPSDIVQEALRVAARRLDNYLRDRPMPFYPWLYVLTRDQLHRRTRQRVPTISIELADGSAGRLADLLADSGSSPSGQMTRNELCRAVRSAMQQLKDDHRDVLVMRYQEGLKLTDIAAILGIGEGAVRMRHLRAIEEMKRLLGNLNWDDADDDVAASKHIRRRK
jgi:RNA polymerase sigma-70 factor (ECF subfamily)